jgi:hypothetical protein
MTKYTFALATVVVLSGVVAGSPAAKPIALRITAPGRAFQGKVAVVTVKAQSFGCKLNIRYSDGQKQSDMFPTTVSNGRSPGSSRCPTLRLRDRPG